PLPPPKTLQQLQVPLLSPRHCRRLYGDSGSATPAGDALCAGFPQGRRDACQVGGTAGPRPGHLRHPGHL
ncbi:BSSP4 protease, partial [Atrichornis clamosus]|nr:BSSP4 protease [Atrichornis clamosus]